jgi:DNA invertase Pin-like site-specific DNA recombinase
LATSLPPRTANDWEGRIYGRLSALPEQAEPLQRAQILAALSVGTEIIRLRRIADRFHLRVELDAALDAVAHGDSVVAIERLGRLDRMLAALPGTGPGGRVRLRMRGSILAMSDALAQHGAYFDSRGAR